ncbi:hypothetical protein K443DRAFT_551500 [Laccaria amethystina LaAM-08-1]|uniref:Uncharacterized protein n=1 Tax=Laccaria amethystina LaAM-08-1 TaxID=1095629 RepID=A0A0C9WH07_9AGAR|nr:hypothetical protein K443DRAFT_551500 [Laccaria amethystina LaAM-08-1]
MTMDRLSQIAFRLSSIIFDRSTMPWTPKATHRRPRNGSHYPPASRTLPPCHGSPRL